VAKKVWRKPEVKQIAAGSAEATGSPATAEGAKHTNS
jgi:hypothetical protein